MMKRFLSILLAVMMVASLGSFAALAADEGATQYGLGDAKMTKDLEVADGIDISKVKTFKFSFTFVDDPEISIGYDATADEVPTITEQTIEVAAQADGHAYGSKALDTIFTDANAFPHAGVYAYTVKETTAAINTTADGVTKTLTVDAAEYTVRLYVRNAVSPATGLVFSGVTVEKAGEKVDPTIKEGEKTSGFNFENTYKEELVPENGVVFTVEKTITGDYADKTKTFPITVELTLPSTAVPADVALKEGSTATLSTDGKTATADLADGGKIEFAKLPAGTTFVVKETQDTAYKSKVTGFVETEDTDYVAGNVNKTGEGPIVEAGKTVTIENNREDVIPTGVIINNLPYILLVVIAGGALAFMALKKKAYKA